MPRQTLTKTTAPGSYGGAFVELTMTAADTDDFEQFTLTGREIVVVTNTSADTNYYVTVTSVDDTFGRSEDITQQDIAFGETWIWGPVAIAGWQQTNGYLYMAGENAALKFGIITLP
jgi:hypothetical protein